MSGEERRRRPYFEDDGIRTGAPESLPPSVTDELDAASDRLLDPYEVAPDPQKFRKG